MSDNKNSDFNQSTEQLRAIITDVLQDPTVWAEFIKLAPQLATVLADAVARRMAPVGPTTVAAPEPVVTEISADDMPAANDDNRDINPVNAPGELTPMESKPVANIERGFVTSPAAPLKSPRASRKRGDQKTVAEYMAMTQATLRTAHAYWLKKHGFIPDNLNTALQQTFQNCYDGTLKTFCGAKRTRRPGVEKAADKVSDVQVVVPQRVPQQPAPVPLYSNCTGVRRYSLFFKDGRNNYISISRNANTPFELVLVDMKTNLAVVRKEADGVKSRFLVINCKTGNMVAKLASGVFEVKYKPDTHELYCDTQINANYSWRLTPGYIPIQTVSVPVGLKKLLAAERPRETLVIEANGTVNAQPLIKLPDANYAIADMVPRSMDGDGAGDKNTAAPTVVTNGATVEQAAPAPMAPAPTNVLSVTVEPVKRTLDGTYNNVYVNGQLILMGHIDTEVVTFLDGTILGVHGIVTDDKKMPSRPVWQVFNPDLQARTFAQMNMYSQTRVYIAQVSESPNGLRLGLSNNSSIVIDAISAHARAKKRRFQIVTKQQSQSEK